MEKIIPKQSVQQWLVELENKDYSIVAPVKDGARWRFEALEKPADIDLEYSYSTPSPKDVLFPQREPLLAFGETGNGGPGKISVTERLPDESTQVIMGIRPCDARGIALMDSVFDEDFEDPYYQKRRHNTILVGLGCSRLPSSNCFCTSVGGAPHDTYGLDVLITDLGDDLFVETLTKKGVQLLDMPGKLFREAKQQERNQSKKIHELSKDTIQREIKNLDHISTALSRMDLFDAKLWEKESQACISCGICTYLCPSCHCFDINDEVETVSPLKGERVRNWDNCQFPDFTMHSSGHNPRPDTTSRLRRRVLHKFRYFVDTNGRYLCTGCGRCVSKCPVGIDIIDVLDKVKDYE